jgi:ribonucleotide reductase alpha subunit
MVCLDLDHPEIVEFINWKVEEEKKWGIDQLPVIPAIMKGSI